jgi:hypothetical protein
MSEQFDEVKITGLDSDRTQPSAWPPGLRRIYLGLSASPGSRLVRADAAGLHPQREAWKAAIVDSQAAFFWV